ncbi:MAG: FHA domain-containing protein [Pseudomonadota bacterium]
MKIRDFFPKPISPVSADKQTIVGGSVPSPEMSRNVGDNVFVSRFVGWTVNASKNSDIKICRDEFNFPRLLISNRSVFFFGGDHTSDDILILNASDRLLEIEPALISGMRIRRTKGDIEINMFEEIETSRGKRINKVEIGDRWKRLNPEGFIEIDGLRINYRILREEKKEAAHSDFFYASLVAPDGEVIPIRLFEKCAERKGIVLTNFLSPKFDGFFPVMLYGESPFAVTISVGDASLGSTTYRVQKYIMGGDEHFSIGNGLSLIEGDGFELENGKEYFIREYDPIIKMPIEIDFEREDVRQEEPVIVSLKSDAGKISSLEKDVRDVSNKSPLSPVARPNPESAHPRAFFVFSSGDMVEISFKKGACLIGSEVPEGRDGFIKVDDQSVSPQHAGIMRRRDEEGFKYFLVDMGSEKGTFLNGEQLAPKVEPQAPNLFENDGIKIGDQLFFFYADEGMAKNKAEELNMSDEERGLWNELEAALSDSERDK